MAHQFSATYGKMCAEFWATDGKVGLCGLCGLCGFHCGLCVKALFWSYGYGGNVIRGAQRDVQILRTAALPFASQIYLDNLVSQP